METELGKGNQPEALSKFQELAQQMPMADYTGGESTVHNLNRQ